MARKRRDALGVPEPSEEPRGIRPIAIQVRGWPEWKVWVERLAAHASRKLGVPVSLNALVGLALAQYAKSLGFKEPPPER
jgi:hypothetical protein